VTITTSNSNAFNDTLPRQ